MKTETLLLVGVVGLVGVMLLRNRQRAPATSVNPRPRTSGGGSSGGGSASDEDWQDFFLNTAGNVADQATDAFFNWLGSSGGSSSTEANADDLHAELDDRETFDV